jgi:hypothetical protein
MPEQESHQPHRTLVSLPPLDSPQWHSSLRTYGWGFRSVTDTVLSLVLFATYLD